MVLNDGTTKITTVGQVKERLIASLASDDASAATTADVRLLHRGRVLDDDEEDAAHAVLGDDGRRRRDGVVRLVAVGGDSRADRATARAKAAEAVERSRRSVKDDLTEEGRRREAARRRSGRAVLSVAAARSGGGAPASRFGRVETLPMLPQRETARSMLEELANDEGVRACMERRGWTVGCLAELYPEGNVGRSPVCVMGLNTNRGQKISLRLRTDDLRGFRKPLSVRKVLYHELAHNVYDEHDDRFFRLMREIERECMEVNRARSGGQRLSTNGRVFEGFEEDDNDSINTFIGGSGRLGGKSSQNATLTKRELALRAAEKRMTAEEEEIQLNCGCGRLNHEFGNPSNNPAENIETRTLLTDIDRIDEEGDKKK